MKYIKKYESEFFKKGPYTVTIGNPDSVVCIQTDSIDNDTEKLYFAFENLLKRFDIKPSFFLNHQYPNDDLIYIYLDKEKTQYYIYIYNRIFETINLTYYLSEKIFPYCNNVKKIKLPNQYQFTLIHDCERSEVNVIVNVLNSLTKEDFNFWVSVKDYNL